MEKLKTDAMLTITEIVALIAERVRNPNDTLRQAKDKVHHRIRYAQKIGDLPEDGGPTQQGNGRLNFGSVLEWARLKWPGKLLDLPIKHMAFLSASATATSIVSGFLSAIPVDLLSCRQALDDASATIRLLQAELASAESEIIRLRPLADRYEVNRAKNQNSAQKLRKNI